MIISKTPFRVSLFGGSTDYESYYSQFGSFLIGFTLDKYCYISFRNTPNIFDYLSKISYSVIEEVNSNIDIKHRGVRGVLEYMGLINEPFEISHQSDLPSQTGIGSSSSFVVGLLTCISKQYNLNLSKHDLSRAAINIERRLLAEPGGIQDQIWAAYGGSNSIEIDKTGKFLVKPLPLSEEFKTEWIKHWSILIYTGKSRNSFDIAGSHDSNKSIEYKKRIHELSKEAYNCFVSEYIEDIGHLLHKSWLEKKSISDKVSNSSIDSLYSDLVNDGMIGGKLLGSGGSGFIYGIVDPKNKYKILNKYKKQYIDFNISQEGSVIINA